MDDYQNDLAWAISALRAARRKLTAGITAYPTPIAGCDAQFNGLMIDRQRIDTALNALASQPFVPTPRVPMPMVGAEAE